MRCLLCLTEFNSVKAHAKFCSKRCRIKHNKVRLVQVECPVCKTSRLIQNRVKKSLIFDGLCKTCLGNLHSGAKSYTWRGGHRYWSPGRLGKDKDGLSWKTQRRLAWERDSYACQHCSKTSVRKPDVHHKIPFRLSHSHALDNLICLCKSCHMKEDARVQENWGGHSLPDKTLKPRCISCGASRRKLSSSGHCNPCRRVSLAFEVKALRDQGLTWYAIRDLLGLPNYQMAQRLLAL